MTVVPHVIRDQGSEFKERFFACGYRLSLYDCAWVLWVYRVTYTEFSGVAFTGKAA